MRQLGSSLSENELVQWVFSFDELNQAGNAPGGYPGNGNSKDGYAFLIRQLCRELLQRHLPMYIEALFAFGRPMRAIELAKNECTISLSTEILTQVSTAIAGRVESLTPIEAATGIRSLAQAALEEFDAQLQGIKNVEEIWLEEISTLKAGIEAAIGEGADYRGSFYGIREVLAIDSRRSRVPAALSKAGLGSLDSDDVAVSEGEPLTRILPLIGLAYLTSDDQDLRSRRYEIRDIVDDLMRAQHTRAQWPYIEAEQKALDRKYGASDPFAPYDLGGMPPSLELMKLVAENRLSDGRYSTWLSLWNSRLLRPAWKPDLQSVEAVDTEEAMEWMALTAESQIKRKVKQWQLGSLESLRAQIQREFEAEWVQKFAGSLFEGTDKSRQLRVGWSSEALERFVKQLVDRLNMRGYILNCPSSERLRILLELLRSTDYLSTYDGLKW